MWTRSLRPISGSGISIELGSEAPIVDRIASSAYTGVNTPQRPGKRPSPGALLLYPRLRLG